MNSVNISGRLGQMPELKQSPNGKSVTSFDIAVKRPFSKDAVDWLTIVCWEQKAEYVCRYGDKGSHIEVSGRIQTRSYTDKNGNKRRVWEIIADNVSFTESRKDGANTADVEPLYVEDNTNDFAEIEDDGDLPF